MKCWTPIVALSFLWVSVFAAYSNQEMRKLLKAKGKHGIIHLSDANYKKVLYGKRDFHLILFLTSHTPQVDCVLCREFTPFYEIVASSFEHTYPDGVAEDGKNVYFLSSEISNSKTIFRELKLDSIPKLYHYSPSEESADSKSFLKDFHAYEFFAGDHADLVSRWVTQETGHEIKIQIPTDYSKIMLNALITFVLALAFKKFYSNISAVLKSHIVWGLSSIVFILLFLAGHMFNQIRSTPFVKESGSKIEYIAPTAQMQYGIETQIISTLYGLLGLTFVILVVRVSKINNAKVQFIATVVVCATLYLLYGIFLNIFGSKYGGYPFKLIKFLAF